MGGAESKRTGILTRGGGDTGVGLHKAKATSQQREKAAICKPSRKDLGEIKPTDTQIVDFQTPEV